MSIRNIQKIILLQVNTGECSMEQNREDKTENKRISRALKQSQLGGTELICNSENIIFKG